MRTSRNTFRECDNPGNGNVDGPVHGDLGRGDSGVRSHGIHNEGRQMVSGPYSRSIRRDVFTSDRACGVCGQHFAPQREICAVGDGAGGRGRAVGRSRHSGVGGLGDTFCRGNRRHYSCIRVVFARTRRARDVVADVQNALVFRRQLRRGSA